MQNGKTVSLQEILWRVATHPLMKDLNQDDAAMYAIEAIKLIGSPLIFVNKLTNPPIVIKGHKALLPDDLVQIRGVKDADSSIAYRYSSDIYHADSCEEDFGACQYSDDYTYLIQSNVITTSTEKGRIIISYQALDVDEDGYPLISDNQKVREAVRYHIMYSHLEGLYDIGKITDRAFQRIEQNAQWYMGAAQSSSVLQGMDHLETTMNAINRLLINNTAHSRGYRHLSKKEINKKYQ